MSTKWKVVLDAVWNYLMDCQINGGFYATAGEVAAAFGVSRVTAWRWLKRMEKAGAIKVSEGHAGDGHPSTIYQAISEAD